MVKELLLSDFNKAQCLIPCYFYVDTLISPVKFSGGRYDLFEFLGDGRPFAQGIDDLTQHNQALLLMMRPRLAQIIPSREADEAVLVYLKGLVDV